LTDPSEVGGFVGAVIQFLGVITAVVAGIVAAKQSSAARAGYQRLITESLHIRDGSDGGRSGDR
jgi:hypothetical protein